MPGAPVPPRDLARGHAPRRGKGAARDQIALRQDGERVHLPVHPGPELVPGRAVPARNVHPGVVELAPGDEVAAGEHGERADRRPEAGAHRIPSRPVPAHQVPGAIHVMPAGDQIAVGHHGERVDLPGQSRSHRGPHRAVPAGGVPRRRAPSGAEVAGGRDFAAGEDGEVVDRAVEAGPAGGPRGPLPDRHKAGGNARDVPEPAADGQRTPRPPRERVDRSSEAQEFP